jgi:phosphatidylglycerol:prolipoprotein diacylglycerol transferase
MAIQRIGCLLTGCCFGNETSSFLGIQYGANTPAYFHEFCSGRLSFANDHSLTIHPVPVYFILSSLFIGFIMLKYRNYWRRPGNLALSGLVIILVSWFIIEFFRDPLSNGTLLGATVLGLKRIQVIYLAIIPMLVLIIFSREKNKARKPFLVQENHPIHNSLYLFILIVFAYTMRNWFSNVEFVVILFVLIPAIIGVLIQVIRHIYSLQVRVSIAFLTVLSFILMSQTLPENQKTTYKSVKFGYSGGGFETYHNIGTGTGCDRVSETQYFHQKFRMAGVGYSVTGIRGKNITEYGLNSYMGSHTELAETSQIESTATIFGLNPFIKYDIKWYGIGAGLHVGSLRFSPIHWVEQTTSKLPTTGTKESPLLPQFYVRFGPTNIAFISYKYADLFPSPFPANNQNLELGSGFGLTNGFNFRIGSDLMGAQYLAAYIPIQNKFVIEPFYHWGGITSTNSRLSQNQFSIGLHYRFGHKTEAIDAK